MSDYQIKVENHGEFIGVLGNPHGSFNMQIPGGDTVTKPIPLNQLKNIHDTIVSMELRERPDGESEFTVTILDDDDAEVALADAVCSNHGSGIVVDI